MTTVVACPKCQRQLHVADEHVGQDVRCPGCAHVFGTGSTAPPSPADDLASPLDEDDPDQSEADVADTERLKRKKAKARGKGSSSGGYYDELMRKQRKMANPHRGVLILVFGICSILCSMGLVGVVFGVLAWNWGTNDLNEMISGRMDRTGRSLTQVGRIIGMVGVCLSVVWVLGSCGCGMFGGLVGNR